MKLMQVGKIHPHPVLLKSGAAQQHKDVKRMPSRGGLSTAESLPSMSAQSSVMSCASATSSRGSLRSQGRPRTTSSAMEGRDRAWDH